MAKECFVDPPSFIQEWEKEDESTWPKPPTPLVDEEYNSFGGIVRKRQNIFPDKVLDINEEDFARKQLKELNHSIMVTYLAIVKKQIDQLHCVSALNPLLEHFFFMLNVMNQTLSAYRPDQAKQYYMMLLEKQVQQKEELYRTLKEKIDEANKKYSNFTLPTVMEEEK